MPVTISAPPSRPTLNQFDLTADVALHLPITVIASTGAAESQSRAVIIKQGSGRGLAYSNGDVVAVDVTLAAITVLGAMQAYVNGGATALQKENALLAQLQTWGLLPA